MIMAIRMVQASVCMSEHFIIIKVVRAIACCVEAIVMLLGLCEPKSEAEAKTGTFVIIAVGVGVGAGDDSRRV